MSQLAADYHADYALPLGLATQAPEDAPTGPILRWAKVLEASQNLAAGRYDDQAYVDAALDACMDQLLDDLSAAG